MLVEVWGYSFICRTTMQLTNNGSFHIRSMYIGHSAGIAGIIEHLWNIKTVLVTNLFWVTWNPCVRSWRVSFCFTVKSYTFLYTNKILSLKFNNCGWICTSNWKMKNQIRKQHLHKNTSEWLVVIAKGFKYTSTFKYKKAFFIQWSSCHSELHVK